MKKYKFLVLASALTLGLTSCDDFGDLNKNPESLNESNVPYAMLFSNGQHQALGSDWDQWRNACIYSAQFMQQLVSLDTWDSYARYQWSDGYSSAYWNIYSGDRGALRDITTCYDLWKDNADMQLDWNIARVMRVLAFSKMTDLFGDIPYSEGGRPQTISYPKYDKQEDIYKSMLAELDEAQANLGSGTAQMGAHDLYFSGNAAKWKKLANSLMLRLAMRLVKVAPDMAKEYAAKAYANGVMESNDDNAKLDHAGGVVTNDSGEPFAKIHADSDREFYLGDTFVNMLKNTNDPRLSLIGTLAPLEEASKGVKYTSIITTVGGLWAASDYGDMTFKNQEGMKTGGYNTSKSSVYWVGKVDARFNDDKFFSEYGAHFSSPNRCTYNDPTAPTFIVTYAQTQFLLAEAAKRGYISGSAKTFYENGVKAAFEQFDQFPNVAAAKKIAFPEGTDAAYQKYIAANPFDDSKALEQINTQYYINSFGDEYEVYANWRRSGYPVLKPAVMAKEDPLCATKDDLYNIPRRFTYPTSESQVNSANYKEAVSRLSNGDSFTSRMWWDKK